MFDRLSNSWELVKASWSVLRSDKELVVFPIVSFFGVILVTISFAIPLFAAGIFQALAESGGSRLAESSAQVISAVVGFLFYLVVYTVIIFSNTALVGAALIRLQGGDPTLGDGFRIARERFGKILGYALISATIGMILNWIRDRGALGQLAASILGFAWNIVTFLAVPVLVIEDVGPIDAIKRSGSLLKKTWGEQLVANFGIGAVFGLLTFGAIMLGMLLTFLLAQVSGGLAVAVIILTILVVIALSLVSSTLSGIFQAALYRYAAEGDAGEFFAPELISGAFSEKNKRGI